MPARGVLLLGCCCLYFAARGTSAAVSAPIPPGVIAFTRLWVSADGHTHLKACDVAKLARHPLPGGKTAQYVRDLKGVLTPSDIIFTQQTGDNPWHQCPTTQFVVTLAGSWFVNTTDGDSVVMGPGHVLFQDDYKGLMVNGTAPQHYSGATGEPCNQMVVSVPRPAAVGDGEGCDWVKQFV